MAYNREKLEKIGMEGFGIVDECFGRMGNINKTTQISCRYRYKPQESRVCMVAPQSAKDGSAASLDCYEAANVYGGTRTVEYPRTSACV